MTSMYTLFWWLRQSLLTLAACFFLMFGIHVLVAAYKLQDPYSFVMAFFASNFIILISAVLTLGFVMKMIRVYRALKENG
jgi:hypothetical protein